MPEGMTRIACEWKMIDFSQGEQYMFCRAETEVPTVAGDWSDMGEVADVFSEVRAALEAIPGENISLDESFTYYCEGELVS